jgi:hypothetical protein
MNKIRMIPVEPNQAKDDVKKLYQTIEKKMNMLPNMFKNRNRR